MTFIYNLTWSQAGKIIWCLMVVFNIWVVFFGGWKIIDKSKKGGVKCFKQMKIVWSNH